MMKFRKSHRTVNYVELTGCFGSCHFRIIILTLDFGSNIIGQRVSIFCSEHPARITDSKHGAVSTVIATRRGQRLV